MSARATRSPAARGRETSDGSGRPACAPGVDERHTDGAIAERDARGRAIRDSGVAVRFAARRDPIGFVPSSGCKPPGRDVGLDTARDPAPEQRSGGWRPPVHRPRAVPRQRMAPV